MVPTPRSNTGTSSRLHHPKPWLEILPSTRFIVFHGGEHEAQSVKLSGVIRLHTPEPMSILKPKVRLEGKRKVSWWYMGGISAGEIVDKRVFWNQEQKLGGIESAHKVNAGTLDWHFEFELSPSMPESVEGLRETYIVYHLRASVSRPGWNAKDIVAQEHIRIVRTLGQDSMEMTRSRVNADVWANKIAYSISIPTDAVVFGTSLTADVELSPIKKGVRLGKIELRLMETVVKRIQASEVPDIRGDRSKTEENEVSKTDMEFPESSRIMYEDETVENPIMADEMYKFKAKLPLPKSLNVCRQDVDSHNINITHRFKLMVNIHNPEGHVSQLVCRLPVKLFISPNLPVDERNEVCPSANGVSDAELNSTETVLVAPPEYGRHQLDQIYGDIDPSGFMSRAGSAPGTPGGPIAQSRRGSHENVLSMNGIVEGDISTNHGSAQPHLLHSRLADLQESGTGNGIHAQGVSRNHSPSGGNSPAPALTDVNHQEQRPTNGSYFPAMVRNTSSTGHSPLGGSAAISRRTSDELHVPIGPTARDYDMDNLSRVPSYGAATRTPGAITPFTDGPPSYVDATSRPPSPPAGAGAGAGVGAASQMQRPGAVHMRTSGTSSPTHLVPPVLTSLNLGATEPSVEEEGRLRMLRARN